MRGYNKCILIGNLTRDPELKYLPSQTAVAEFGIAMNRKWRDAEGNDKEDVTFVDCAAFGKTGEIINEHFRKGKPIMVEGRLKYDSWEGKDGSKRSKLTVVVESFTFVGGPPGDQQGGDGGVDDHQGGGSYADQRGGGSRAQPQPRQQQRSNGNGGGQQNRPQQRQGGQQRSRHTEADIPF